MRKLTFLTLVSMCSLVTLSQAQYRYTVLHYFNNATGEVPFGSLTLSNGILYGMTFKGGASDTGCIFSMDTTGAGYTDLFDFNGTNGANPWGSLTLSQSTLFGMAWSGVANGFGCIFKMLTNGSGYVDLLDFNSSNGANPKDNVILNGSTLYGMTEQGGAFGYGLIFSIDTNGNNYTDLVDFNDTNGAYPQGSLILAGNVLYGMTFGGGDSTWGCVFSVHTDGSGYRDLYSFGDTRLWGINPQGSLILSGKTLYGLTTTSVGGILISGGTAFKIDTDGNNFKKFFNLIGANVGRTPTGSLVLSDSLLYGMTSYYTGKIFSIDTAGAYSDIYSFASLQGGYSGCKSLTVSGTEFYGMASLGGADTDNFGAEVGGVIFKLVDTGIFYPQVTMNSINVSCNGGNNGSATASVSGGVSPYTYLWQPSGNTTNSLTGLNAGVYTLSVTGNNDSTNTVFVTITQPAVLNPSEYLILGINCNGNNNAVDSVSGNGGAAPFTYLWSDANSQTTATASGLSAGNYTVSISDSCGNSATALVVITQPLVLSITADSINATSGNCDGSAWVVVNGGTVPYTYSWTGGLTTDTISNQCIGNYCCTVTDSSGCMDSICVNIDISTGTNKLTINNEQLTIYPNPNDGSFTLQIDNGQWVMDNEKPYLEIYNTLGQQIYSQWSIVNFPWSIDLSSQPSGVYFYRLIKETGELVGEGKILVVHN